MCHSLIWIIEDETYLPDILPHIREFSYTRNHIISLSSTALNLIPNSPEQYAKSMRLLRHILQHDTSKLPLKNIGKFEDFVARESASTIIVGQIGSEHAKRCLYDLLAHSSTPCLYIEGNMYYLHNQAYYCPTWQFLYTSKNNILVNMECYPHSEHHLFTYRNTHLPDHAKCIKKLTDTIYFKYISIIYIKKPDKLEGVGYANNTNQCYIAFFDSNCDIEQIYHAINQARQQNIKNIRFILSNEQAKALKSTMAYPYIYILNTNFLYYLHSCDQLLVIGDAAATLQIYHSNDPITQQVQHLVQEIGCHMTWHDTGIIKP